MRPTIGDFIQRRIAVARRPGRKPLVVENARHQFANIGFVIDNQNVTSHGSRLSCQLPVAASILVSLLVVSGGALVSAADAIESAVGCLASPACTSIFFARPVMAKRSRIQAPR